MIGKREWKGVMGDRDSNRQNQKHATMEDDPMDLEQR